MARTVTVSSIVSQIRQRADLENDTDRFPDSELATYVSQSWCELYNEIVLTNGDHYLSNVTQVITPGLDTYALPADFYLDRGVDFVQSGYTFTLPRWSFEERESYQFAGSYAFGMPTSYRIIGGNVVFKPVPQSGSYKLYYYPTPTVLTIASSVDGIAGFEEFLVLDGALKALRKDNRVPPELYQDRNNALAVVRAALAGRSHSHPDRIISRYGYGIPRLPWPR
jgi:hypothetical protein